MFAWREKINWVERVRASAKSGFGDKHMARLYVQQAGNPDFVVVFDTIKSQKSNFVQQKSKFDFLTGQNRHTRIFFGRFFEAKY